MSATDQGFTNQRRTEPVPPSPPHEPPKDGERAPMEAGAVDSPGPREGAGTAGTPDARAAGPGAPPEETRPVPDLDARATHQPHDPRCPDQMSVGHAYRAPGHQGESAEPFGVDTVEGARRMHDDIASSDIEQPGDPGRSPAPSYLAAHGTSETSEPVDGIRMTAIAQPGKPDGEVDTRLT